MNKIFKRVLIITVAVAVLATGIGLSSYLFYFDRRKPQVYQPQVETAFLLSQIERIESVDDDIDGEVLLSQDGFNGILVYSYSEQSAQDIDDCFKQLSLNKFDGELITFPENSCQIFVHSARYTPIVEALGYGWLHYDGNVYATRNGRAAAKDKPNYRNFFCFTIGKDNGLCYLQIYCNTSDAEKALKQAIDYINTIDSKN